MKPARQRGLALITAVLVVAMASVAATSMVVSQTYSVRRTANLLHGEQAESFAVGAESWAKVLLKRDATESKIDTLEEDWAQPLAPIAVEGGALQGSIEDEQGRFNVNNLVLGDGTKRQVAKKYYESLLAVLGLDPALVNVLIDWIDDDIDPSFPGAEDDTYLLKSPPYRTANTRMADISELRLVEGYTPEVVAALLPHVCALPEETTINVNTATDAVLAALTKGGDLKQGESMVESRADKPYESVEQFIGQATNRVDSAFQPSLDVQSRYFRMAGQVQVGRGQVWISSLFRRDGSKIQLVSRSRVLPVMPAGTDEEDKEEEE